MTLSQSIKAGQKEFGHTHNCLGKHDPGHFPGNNCECLCHYGNIRGLLITAFAEFSTELNLRPFGADMSDITIKYEDILQTFLATFARKIAEEALEATRLKKEQLPEPEDIGSMTNIAAICFNVAFNKQSQLINNYLKGEEDE